MGLLLLLPVADTAAAVVSVAVAVSAVAVAVAAVAVAVAAVDGGGAAAVAVAAGGEVGRCCRNISALPMLMLLSPRCTDPLLQGSLDEQLACKRGLENRRIRREREESMGYFWEP